jgi:sulfur carrier protein
LNVKILVNGEEKLLSSEVSVADLLNQLGYREDFIAVAVNNECIKRAKFGAHLVREQDRVEILAPMAGG